MYKLGRSLIAAMGISLMAFAATPALAADLDPPSDPTGLVTSGVIDLFGGVQFLTGQQGNVDATHSTQAEFGAVGRISFALSPAMSIQMDAGFSVLNGVWNNNTNTDNFDATAEVGGHISWRNPSSFLLGVFGGGVGGGSEDEAINGWFIGGEGQLYFDNFTIYGQAGYFDGRSENGTAKDAVHNGVFGRLVGRYFVSDMTRLQGEVSIVGAKQDNDDQNTTIVGWGVRFDHTLESYPLDVFLKYRGAYYDNGNGGDSGHFTDHTVAVGISFSFGSQGMLAKDRTGATLDLPEFGRWIASGNILD